MQNLGERAKAGFDSQTESFGAGDTPSFCNNLVSEVFRTTASSRILRISSHSNGDIDASNYSPGKSWYMIEKPTTPIQVHPDMRPHQTVNELTIHSAQLHFRSLVKETVRRAL
jgi:hypothetical protein